MKKVILVRYGEIVLKGLNRPVFEDRLIKNIRRAIQSLGKVDIIKSQARIFIEPVEEEYDFAQAMERMTRVFGIVSISPVWKVESDLTVIQTHALEMVNDLLDHHKYRTFKVETKRGNKKFPLQSPEVSREVGAHVLSHTPQLSVDVHNPDFILYVEVRESAYIYSEIIPSHGGMPIGSNGKAMLLLSGGIDSPVAGWMIAKRGVEVDAVHFYSYPYTSERAKEKVIDLSKILASYTFRVNLHVVPFTDIQLQINDRCPAELMTVIMRRIMMQISQRIAQKVGAMALITGESLGQVASQTMHALHATNAVAEMPVFRPLIGMDKNEVIEIARKIGSFETSILPYEDCCTVFVAKHPKTKPRMDEILEAEKALELENLIEVAIENTEVLKITP